MLQCFKQLEQTVYIFPLSSGLGFCGAASNQSAVPRGPRTDSSDPTRCPTDLPVPHGGHGSGHSVWRRSAAPTASCK